MIKLPSFLKPKQPETAGKNQKPADPLQPKLRQDPSFRYIGEVSEKTQDFLGGHDGERVGFRKPVQG